MKVKVVNRFIDKETRKLYEYGDVIEITKARFDEISAVGKYVKLLGDDEKPLEKMNVDELKEYAQAHGIELNEGAKKAEIFETIKAAEDENAE